MGIGTAIGILVVIGITCLVVWCCCLRHRNRVQPGTPNTRVYAEPSLVVLEDAYISPYDYNYGYNYGSPVYVV